MLFLLRQDISFLNLNDIIEITKRFQEEVLEEKLIKSKHRVQKHGEVFTPAWMVQKMLDTPGVKEACENVSATFLEPAAGDGNFLLAILERKLQAVNL